MNNVTKIKLVIQKKYKQCIYWRQITKKTNRKKRTMNKIIITAFILQTIFIVNIYGQSKKFIFWGIQPGITVEPFYEEGEFDVNVFPLIIETPISPKINLRISPIANYHIGGIKNGFSDLGVFTVLPFFFRPREDEDAKPYGLYLGPVFGFVRNSINNHYTTTLALEPGYMFEAKKSFTITLGVQFGASYFAYDSKPNKWLSHWGPKVSFGFWLN